MFLRSSLALLDRALLLAAPILFHGEEAVLDERCAIGIRRRPEDLPLVDFDVAQDNSRCGKDIATGGGWHLVVNEVLSELSLLSLLEQELYFRLADIHVCFTAAGFLTTIDLDTAFDVPVCTTAEGASIARDIHSLFLFIVELQVL